MLLAGALLAPSIGFAQVRPPNKNVGTAVPVEPNATYDAVVKGMSCKQQQNGRMECSYQVGEGLRFVISGVGQIDVVMNVLNVDSLGTYVAGFAPLHGCVIVRPSESRPDSLAHMAFVSPHDGKVYRNWNTCLRQAPKR